MRIAFLPLDVVFFRDARAFGAGADHRAFTLLPPQPTTVHGALRAWLASQRGWRPGSDLPAGLGSAEDPGELRVRGPFLARLDGERAITRHPFPADAAVLGDGDGTLRVLARRSAAPPWILSDADADAIALAPPGSGTQEEPPAGLEAPQLLRNLRGEEVVIERETSRRLSGYGLGLAAREPRTGIALDRGTRTAREGLLYTAEYARLADDAALVADVWLGDDDPPIEQGVVALGGERRLAGVRPVEPDDWELGSAIQALVGRRRLRLYLLSAAPFPGGSRPLGLEQGEGVLAGRRVRLVGEFVGRPVRVGGFDLARGRPRPSRWAVPPGSVYRVELLDGPADEELVRTLHGRSLFPEGSVEERIGWGQVLLGTYVTAADPGG